MFDTLDAEMPPLAGLINNAGILFAKARVDEMGPDRINDTCASTSPARSCVPARPSAA
jgi:NAD(P)-dependent dehydrogenase (short-subunit alcohol dehydrogenase family)